MPRDEFRVVSLRLDEPSRLRRRRAWMTLGVTLLVGSPVLAVVLHEHLSVLADRSAYWSIWGPPCEPLDPAAFHRVSRPPSVTPYDGALFLRHGGGVTCTHRTEPIDGERLRYPVCKFTAPDYLGVRLNGHDQFFDLTMGRAASVGVVRGKVRCAVVPKFEM